MDIIWDERKNTWLKLERGISFELIAERIMDNQYVDIVENPTRGDQLYFVMLINGYTWLIPFIIDEHERLVLKTAFPSRKYHKKYGERQ